MQQYIGHEKYSFMDLSISALCKSSLIADLYQSNTDQTIWYWYRITNEKITLVREAKLNRNWILNFKLTTFMFHQISIQLSEYIDQFKQVHVCSTYLIPKHQNIENNLNISWNLYRNISQEQILYIPIIIWSGFSNSQGRGTKPAGAMQTDLCHRGPVTSKLPSGELNPKPCYIHQR